VTEIPLFPVSAVLLPHGRMPLQIFEQRYIELVRDCMRSDRGFGLIWIRKGSEIIVPGGGSIELAENGCYARITDFDQLPNGLLGVTIEGQQRFELDDVHTRDNGLVMGQVDMECPPLAEPMISDWDSMSEVLQSLLTHPHVQRMQLDIDVEDAWQVGYQLGQLLPLEEALKYQLLCAPTVTDLMAELELILNELGSV